jgi:serine/threonine-protein kinase HipA
VGELRLVRTLRGVSLVYAESWLGRGFALTEDLPLIEGQEFLPLERDTAVGAVDDARPDRWGERVIRFLDKPARLSLLEYLYFAGDERFGALGVSTSATEYLPRRFGPLPVLADTETIAELVRKVLANEPVAPELRRLISPGVTMGGARPKALLEVDGQQWVVKFADGDPVDTPLVEHASMTLAARAQIRVAETRAVRLSHGHAVAVRRFDRGAGRRHHALSANVALKAAGETIGYPELAQLLRRRGTVMGDLNLSQMRELFRRMVFNILLDNTDDRGGANHRNDRVVPSVWYGRLLSGIRQYPENWVHF